MNPSPEFFIVLAALAACWLSLRSDIRALTAELRALEGHPDKQQADLEFERALAAVTRTIKEPVSPREVLEANR